MKLLEKIFSGLHSLPEEVRRFLAGIGMLLAALLIFSSWYSNLPAKLVMISSPTLSRDVLKNGGINKNISVVSNPLVSSGKSLAGNFYSEKEQGGQETLSPLTSVWQTLKFLKKLAENNLLLSWDTGIFTPVGENMAEIIVGVRNIFFETWHYVHDPFR